MMQSFHPEALEEYLGAVSYYADINPRLGKSFIEAIEFGLQNIRIYPKTWQIVTEDVRRHLIKRFPYGIYYCIEENWITIYAVMHMSRHPDYWKNRIGSKDPL